MNYKSLNMKIPFLKFIALIFVFDALGQVHALSAEYTVTGIGYREQELQVAKGSKFQSEEAKGV
jgi:hypothetical protein